MANLATRYSLLTTKNLKMITTDQIKAAIDRVEALNKYLNIEEKKIQLEEEELKTQAPEFWQDQKRADPCIFCNYHLFILPPHCKYYPMPLRYCQYILLLACQYFPSILSVR